MPKPYIQHKNSPSMKYDNKPSNYFFEFLLVVEHLSVPIPKVHADPSLNYVHVIDEISAEKSHYLELSLSASVATAFDTCLLDITLMTCIF